MGNSDRGGGHGGEQKIQLVYVVNGEDVPVDANVNAPLAVAAEHALRDSQNLGSRPLDQWEVRDAKGVLLEMTRKVGDLGLQGGSRLFLSLRAGAGGSKA
jgi:hypothetical protein